MADPTPLPKARVPRRYRRLHGILTGATALALGVAGILRWRWPHVADPKIGLIVPSGVVVAATFLFTAVLVFGPYRRGLLYKVAKGKWPEGEDDLGDAGRLAEAYGARLAVPWGLIAASGVFNAVVYGVQGHWPNLAIAAGCLVLLLLLAPRQAACARFVERGQAALPALRAGP